MKSDQIQELAKEVYWGEPYDHARLAAFLERVDLNLEQLRAAVENPGPNPAYHYRMMDQHRKEWPTLWNAIDKLLKET